jgi:carboxylesterase type B
MERVTLKILFFMGIAILVSSSDPVVTTELGEIIGKTTTLPLDLLPYKDVHQYLGIPYAEAPVGERRFLKPEVLSNLIAPYDAKSHGAMCPQSTFGPIAVTMSEDCLFLNVYVPDQPSDKPSGHAVMVWIHGGGFREGAGSQYDGSFIAAYGNVIVVTVNYRLGLFGFLSTGDKTVPGNAGLWDQRMALQWVNMHINSFEGDKNRVTVVGESAGAMSTMQHGFMPENRGLF